MLYFCSCYARLMRQLTFALLSFARITPQAALLVWALTPAAQAATPVYLAPAAQQNSDAPQKPQSNDAGIMSRRDGSRDAPFLHLADAISAVSSGQGDHVALLPGAYGSVIWKNIAPLRTIDVRAETTGQVHFDRLVLDNVHNLTFSGFSVWPRKPVDEPGTLVTVHASSSHLTFDRFDLRGRADAPQTYMRWRAKDWLRRWRNNGFRLAGPDMRVQNSAITGVAFGITSHGTNARLEHNLIRGFSGDALRAVGNHSYVAHNRVQDCFAVDKNHDDGFQAWAPRHGGARTSLVGLRLEHNQIWEWTGRRGHPLRCQLQGVGLFDGQYRDIEIRNNLVVVDHHHGISIYGAINGVIANNTVVHPSGNPAKLPWISVNPHKNGTPSRNIEVSHNLAMAYKSVPDALAQNTVARFPAQLFENPAAGDFRPRPDGPLRVGQEGANLPAPLRDQPDLTGLPQQRSP
ncbi:hypothetical protein GFB49_13980 [Epibacterium sp. SM1979]|uniref:Right handed beta helix domain-containing protein n=2 Tax=Tritonibacter litoralis TaxID=2662264 RepID=A0A843YK25_9RHOB|nr:hypothetical protein [Tritonibacter litoralis]